MNTKEANIKLQQEQAKNENYTGIITFNQKLYEKTIAIDLSIKDPRNFMKKLDDFLTRKLIHYFKLYTTKQSIKVQHLQKNIRLRLMGQDIMKKKIAEIPSKDQDVIKYLHLQGI